MGGTIDKILGIGDQGGADVRDGSMNRGISTTLRDNTKSTQEYLNIVYGTILTGGNQVFITNSGGNNKFEWIVQNISEGECNGIKQRDGVDQIFLDDKLWTEYGTDGSLVEYWFYSGTDTQTFDTNLNDVFNEWDDNKRNTCYIVMKLQYSGNYFQRTPKILIEMEGKLVYDFRDTTWKFSNNPVLILYDFMRSDRYGTGLAADKIDEISWTSAANYCDTKGWTMNGAITKRKAQDLIDSILQLFRGNLTWYDGKYYLSYRDMNYESVVMTLNDYHIMQDSSGKMRIKISAPSSFSSAAGMRVKFKDPEQAYVEDDFILGDTLGKIEELNLSLVCTDRDHAAQIGVYNLERLQLNRQITGTFRDDAFQLDPGDLINVSFETIAIQGTMRVEEVQLNTNGSVDLNLLYESPLLYDDDYNLILKDIYVCTLPDPNAIPPSVTNITLDEEYYDYRGRSFTRLNIEFDVPDGALWDHVEIWTSLDDVSYRHWGNTTNDFSINNILEGEQYYIKLRSVSLYEVKQSLDDCPKVTWLVFGVEELPPPSMLYLAATVNQSGINLYSDKLPYADIEIYEFRQGSWSGGLFMGALRAPNLSLTGVKPGTYTFYANTLGTNGLYGEVPVSATATVPDPPAGWSLYNRFEYFYNLVANGHFEEGTSGWNPTRCTLASIPGGVSSNCLEVTRTAGIDQVAWQSIVPTLIEEETLYYEGWVKSGTAGDTAFEIGIWNATGVGGWQAAPQAGTSSGTWTKVSGIATLGPGDLDKDLQFRFVKNNASAGTMLFDEAFIIVQAKFQGTEYTIYSNDDHLKGTHTGQDYRNGWSALHASGNSYDLAQRWWPFRDIDGEITYGRLFLQRVGSPTGNLKLYIYPKEGAADEPDYVAGPIATSEDVDVTGIGTSWEWVTFEFSTSFSLTEDTTYFLVLKAGDFTGNDSDTIQWGRGSYSGIAPWDMGSAYSINAGTTWTQSAAYDFCFQVDEFVGRWTSRLVRVGGEDDYLTYSLYEVIQVGGGNLWEDFSPLTNTWDDIGTTSLTWGELLQLDAAGQVKQKFFWGDDLGNINKVAEKQEILTILADSCEFFYIQLTIIDPNADIFMHVTEIEQKFLT
jgi:hypothetical protein